MKRKLRDLQHRLQKDHFSISIYYLSISVMVSPEGGPLSGSESGVLSNTQKWIVWGDTRTDKAKDFIGKGRPGGEQQGKGSQENCSAMWLPVSGFMVMGLAFQVVSGHSSCSCPYLVWLRVLPGGTCISQPRWIPAWGFLGNWQDIWTGISSLL